MAAPLHLALLLALMAPKAPPKKAPPPIHNPLIIPIKQANLSAFRLDTEVFGWNKNYTEVASVTMEMARDAAGAHRGETFLLVYPTRSTKPKHNVICHFITHVALPDNPVPLEDAGDYMWTIEWSYQNMWPRRPKRHQPKGAMSVTPLWAPMPPEPDHKKDASATPLKHYRTQSSHNSCQPWVGFKLQRGREVRLHPYRPLDLSARCELLQLTNSRTYWGTQDVAASMVRFDFNASPDNEESARFVVSALWQEGKQVQFVLRGAPAAPPKALALWRKTLAPWGALQVLPAKSARSGSSSHEAQKLIITAATEWLPMARSLAADAGYPNAPFEAHEDLHETIVFTLMPQHTQAPPSAGPREAPTAAEPEAPIKATPKTADTPPSRYLQDFKVP